LKATYLEALSDARSALVEMRAPVLVASSHVPIPNTDDLPPDFSPLAVNQEMRGILTRRWQQCAKCVKTDAHLAAIVMMGGLLEAVIRGARANKLTDKSALIGATVRPKIRQLTKL
jgi:hypothetical protein